MRSRVLLASPVLALALGLVAGCSGDDETVAPRPEVPTTSAPLWNPCDGLAPAEVADLFATRFAVATGTDDAPRCVFTPPDDGGVAIDVNYQQFSGTMDDLFASFGELEEGAGTEVLDPEVPDADAARVVVDVADGTLAVTGFVQNGELVQIVNALDPAPFDREQMTAGVETVLADLAAHASDKGVD